MKKKEEAEMEKKEEKVEHEKLKEDVVGKVEDK